MGKVNFENERTLRDFTMPLETEGYQVKGSVTTKNGAVVDASMSVIYPNTSRTVPVYVNVRDGEVNVNPGQNPISVAKEIIDAVEDLVTEATAEQE